MELEEGRTFYSEILRRSRNASYKAGSRQILPGVMLVYARQVWHEAGSPGTFADWWSEVHTLGLTPRSDKAPRQSKRNGGKGPYLDRYRAMAMKHMVLPTDAWLLSEWECDKDTVGRIRSKLHSEGFVFQKQPDKSFHVIQRPELPPVVVADPTPAPVVAADPTPAPVVAAVPTPAPVVAAVPTLIATIATEPKQLPLVADAEQIGAMIHELLVVSKSQLQMQAGTYRKLGELVELFTKAWQ